MKRITKKLFTLLLAVMVIVSTFTMHVSAATTTPAKVTLTSAKSSAYNKVTLTWKKTSGSDRYYIYYRKAGASKWTKLGYVKSGVTTYTHTASKSNPITVGQKYQYRVRGYNTSSKKYGSYSSALTVNTTPNPVTLISAKANSKKTQVTLTWKAAKGCNYYRIYRKVAGGKWATIANVPSSQLTYVDKAPVKGKTNIYTIRGYYSKTKVLSAKYNKTGLSVNLATSSPHTHSYGNATCTKPATCSCGATNGSALGHNWVTTEDYYMLCTCGYISYDGNDMAMHTILNGCPGWCGKSKYTTSCSICGAQP